MEALLDQIDHPIGAVTKHSAGTAVIIPPRANAAERPDTDLSCQRDRYIAAINADRRMKWQAATEYGKRSLV